MTASRIGLLGGTFDPPHVGHLVVAESARIDLGLDEFRLLVAGTPWMKGEVTDAAVRTDLVERAVADAPGLDVDARETRRRGPTHTIDTLEELRAERADAEWFFILGADVARDLPRWHRAAEVVRAAHLVLVERPGVTSGAALGALLADDALESSRLMVPRIDVSSSDLRARYRRGAATRHLVPPAVDDRIRALGLYGAPGTGSLRA